MLQIGKFHLRFGKIRAIFPALKNPWYQTWRLDVKHVDLPSAYVTSLDNHILLSGIWIMMILILIPSCNSSTTFSLNLILSRASGAQYDLYRSLAILCNSTSSPCDSSGFNIRVLKSSVTKYKCNYDKLLTQNMFWQDLQSQLQNCINAIGAESWKPMAGG